MLSQTTLAIDSVTKSFGGLTANDNISFEFGSGEFVGVVGPNGAGKSTLVETICGRLRPDKGVIRLNGEDITRLPSHVRAIHGLGRTFQGGSLFPDLDVMTNLRVGGHARAGHLGAWRFMLRTRGSRQATRSVEEKALEVADRVGISSLLNVRAGDLSRGEQQLVALAIAMAGEPKLLVLDEPLAGLERAEIDRLLGVLAKLRIDDRVGVLMVEHNLEVVRMNCERLIVLDLGRVIASGAPATVLAETYVQQAYLGVHVGDVP